MTGDNLGHSSHTTLALAAAVVLTMAGLAVLVVDIAGGRTSTLLGVIPYVLILPVAAMAFTATKKGKGWRAVLLAIVPILFIMLGMIMAATDPNRHWP